MTDAIVAGDKVKWLRLYKGGWETIYYGTVVAIEVGAEIPCAIVQPKGRGEQAQRVEACSLLRADDSRNPKPNGWDMLCREKRIGLRELPEKNAPYGCERFMSCGGTPNEPRNPTRPIGVG